MYDERMESSYIIVNFITILVLSALILIINKFKYKETNYENIELIGTKND
jgi:hypothetical protein